jgi:hypothetical protein
MREILDRMGAAYYLEHAHGSHTTHRREMSVGATDRGRAPPLRDLHLVGPQRMEAGHRRGWGAGLSASGGTSSDVSSTSIWPRSLRKSRWRTAATIASFPEAVRENEEVVPVNAVSTWVLPCGVTVGR